MVGHLRELIVMYSINDMVSIFASYSHQKHCASNYDSFGYSQSLAISEIIFKYGNMIIGNFKNYFHHGSSSLKAKINKIKCDL